MFIDANNPEPGENQGQNQETDFDEGKFPKFSELDPENLSPEQAKELITAGQTLLGQAKHWHKKANPPKPAAPARADNQPAPNIPADTQLSSRLEKLELSDEKRHFGFKHKLSPEETDRAFALAKGQGIKPDEVLNDPFFKNGLTAMREEERVKNGIPGPSSRRPVVEGKTFSQLSREEKVKNFGNFVQNSKKRQG